MEILQRTLEEQGVAFGSARAKEEDRRRADRRLREEQDAAYLAALKLDQVFIHLTYLRIQFLYVTRTLYLVQVHVPDP